MTVPRRNKGGRPRAVRQIEVTPVRRDEIDIRRLARALLAIAKAEALREEGNQTDDQA